MQATDPAGTSGDLPARLDALLDASTDWLPEGFSVRLEPDFRAWDACFRGLGLRQACARMAQRLCAGYRARFGRDFLFSDDCVAYELRYHIAAYMAARGLRGYRRHVTTLLFTRARLIARCREIDISTQDAASLRQRLIFGYRRGVRACFRGTQADPFRRGPR